MNKGFIAGIVVLLVVGVFILASLGLFKSNSTTGNVVKNLDSEKTSVKEFVMQSYTEVIDGKYYPKFTPNVLNMNKGDLVRIKVTNTKGTHDFNIDEFNIHSKTPLNEEVLIEFVADKSGEFEYYCSMPGHRQAGHWGTLRVAE